MDEWKHANEATLSADLVDCKYSVRQRKGSGELQVSRFHNRKTYTAWGRFPNKRSTISVMAASPDTLQAGP
jgi:hypothetical protein